MLSVVGELGATVVPRRLATRSSPPSGFGSAVYQSVPPPFRKRSVMHKDLEIHPSAKTPGCAINQATRAHFANSIQRTSDDIWSSSTPTATQLASDCGLVAERLPRTAPATVWCSNDYLGMGVTQGSQGRSRGGGASQGRRWRHPQKMLSGSR
jgi:hypothetical protein